MSTGVSDNDSVDRANRLVEQVSGLRLDVRRTPDIQRLADRVAPGQGLDTLDEFCTWLTSASEDTVRSVVGEISIKETYFFRAPRQFDVAFKELALHVARARAAAPNTHRSPLRMWSAGCSTGEEPYSLAFTALKACPDVTSADVRILATDISEQALTTARAGVYPAAARTGGAGECVDGDVLLDKYAPIQPDGTRAVRGEARRLVTFAKHSVFHDEVPCNQDIIFCRNLMIYFRIEQQPLLVERLTRALRPGGLLFLGDAELLHVMRHDLEPLNVEGTLVYRRSRTGGTSR